MSDPAERKMTCPACGAAWDEQTCVTGEKRGPQPGDLNLCVECAGVLTMQPDGSFRNITEAEVDALEPETREGIKMARAKLGQLHYSRQLDRMHHNARAWRASNPTREALVQFNYPPGVMLIQPISEAVRIKTVTTNEAGLELLKALWPWDDKSEPTVLMCRVVLEYEKTEGGLDKGR